MADNLENLIRKTESDIARQAAPGRKPRNKGTSIPRLGMAIGIWLVVIVAVALEFGTITSLVSGPAESRVESDLGEILNTAAASLRRYQDASGALPHLLPNPAIRGLVTYERHSDFSFRLRASINEVSMVLESSWSQPRRDDQ